MINLITRITNIIDVCWESFSAKVGCGLLVINKEASMQLNFAYLLKNTVDLAIYHEDEIITIELENSISINGRMRECDILVKIEKGEDINFIPIEMKCYKTKTSSGKLRGAQDIFKYSIYEDLQLLESYEDEFISNGIQLTMTDYRGFPFPKSKEGKSWDYDVSDGKILNNGIELFTPIGGKNVSTILKKSYTFNWQTSGEFYFLKIKGF